MDVISLIDNLAPKSREDLLYEHGLSLHIRTQTQQILFDTGISGIFSTNAQKLGLEVGNVTHAVLSHHHYDHAGGLGTFLQENHQSNVYLRRGSAEQYYLILFGLYRRQVGMYKTLYDRYPSRFTFIKGFTEIAPDVFIITDIGREHRLPRGDRHLFMRVGSSIRADDFKHELLMVVRQNNGLVVFNGCAHHGILNMLDAVQTHFPEEKIQALFGGFHLIDMPHINNMAGSKAEVAGLGRSILKYKIGKVYTGHCTGLKAYRILKDVMGGSLEYFATGDNVVV